MTLTYTRLKLRNRSRRRLKNRRHALHPQRDEVSVPRDVSVPYQDRHFTLEDEEDSQGACPKDFRWKKGLRDLREDILGHTWTTQQQEHNGTRLWYEEPRPPRYKEEETRYFSFQTSFKF